ncbi:DUF3857 domain-containing protein [Pseudotamlana carrageenivorans]|uniref:DUF3857 domain-containing protein n=1 Tax=Pseudotamlana carrageenivorans TaxID=2069432 RepID=A0A2I7SIL9_9FLAO|nr:DUF3857 domain-containing protein [Tamlana carrageenivorans]AUS05746.1 hypothetical protein C1A40_09830 [Tamlana carrageenivorans]
MSIRPQTYAYYDNSTKIKDLEILVFDAFGDQIDKIKEGDFNDVSAVGGGTLYSDSRVKYFEYTPVNYPYTIEYNYEYVNESTAFIRSFMPVSDYLVSVEKSNYTISCSPEMTLRLKEINFQDFNIVKQEHEGGLQYEANHIKAFKSETYGPEFFEIAPQVLFALSEFNLEGVFTKVNSWNDFGKWIYHDLIADTHDLSESQKAEIVKLVQEEPNNLAKAKKIYEYVQSKTRYISVQVGIGGWKPFNASEVDALGYGDCKGLTNYTMALLDAAGIPSYYTVVYAGAAKRNFENDFAAMQGNHAILNIPNEGGDIWLECTSQKLPFGFIGDFTDDRDVLVVTPEGGVIKHTKKYSTEENSQYIKGDYKVLEDGAIEAQAQIVSRGIQYDDKYSLETETTRELDKAYKHRWGYINRLVIENMHIENNKTDISFTEDVRFSAGGYARKVGDRILVTLNVFNRFTEIPDRYRNRKWPVKISRGFKDVDEVEIKLPSGYQVESKPKDLTIKNKFGSYTMTLEALNETTLIYKRELIMNDGVYPKEDYNAFRNFYKEVSKLDNSKIALIKTNL